MSFCFFLYSYLSTNEYLLVCIIYKIFKLGIRLTFRSVYDNVRNRQSSEIGKNFLILKEPEGPKSFYSSSKMLKLIKRRLPITTWLPKYTKRDGISDLIAGVTVGMTVVPQSLGYAAIAGLSPEYGLYSSYIAILIYVILGSCKQATIGPTAVMGLLTYQTCGKDYPACVILTAFYAGCFELIMAILQLGWVVSFISEPVTIGFTSGAALTILSSQLNSFLGLSGEKGNSFISYWQSIFKYIKTTSPGDATLGILSFITLMALRKLKDVNVKNKHLKTVLWLVSLSRNVIVILTTSLMALIWNEPPFKLVGKVQGGFPSPALPQFELSYRPHWENGTLVEPNEYYSFIDTWSILKTGPFVICVVSILQNVAISKAFGSGQAVDSTQEMLALGTGSVIGSFFRSIPVSASFSRSAVNEASGVRSQLGGMYTGILVILALNFLSASFYWIPKASLAAVIIGAVIFMIDYESILPMYRISKIDALSWLITFISAVVLGMEYGILIGCAVSIGALLIRSLRPEINSELRSDLATGVNYVLISPSNGVNFPSVDYISTSIQKISLKHKECRVIIVDFGKWVTSDYTAATTLVCIEKGMRKNEKIMGFLNCGDNWVRNFKIGGLSNPPVILNEGDISRFIKDKLKIGEESNANGKRASLGSVVVEDGSGSPAIPNSAIYGSISGMTEGVGGISVASTGSTADVTSLASSTKPII